MRGVLLDPVTGRPAGGPVHRDPGDEYLARREFGVLEFDPRTGRRWGEPTCEDDAIARDAVLRAPAHVLESLHRARELHGAMDIRNSLNSWNEVKFSSVADEAALTAAAEAVVFPASTREYYYGLIPGGAMVAHKTYHLRVSGQLSTAATPGTMLWAVRWGGLAGAALVKSNGAGATGTAITMAASQTNTFWRAEFYLTSRGSVASPTSLALICSGILETEAIPTKNMVTFPLTAPAQVASLDGTTDKDLAITHTPSLATASFAGRQYTLTSLN